MEVEESKDLILTREGMVHRLKELEYNSLAAALETGTMEKLDIYPLIQELRTLHATSTS